MTIPKKLDAITDIVLSYRPKPKSKAEKRRKKKKTKEAKDARESSK